MVSQDREGSWELVQVDVPFCKHIDDSEKLLIPNPIVVFGRRHFF